MSSWLQKIAGPVLFAALLIVLVFFNFIQMLSVIIFPFSKKTFRSINRGLAGAWWGMCVLATRKLNCGRLVLSGDSIPYKENAIIIVNHRDMSDILQIMMLAMDSGRISDLKWFVKDVLKFVPGVGWGMLFLDCVFVKRNWDADKNKINSTFKKFQKNDIPFWLISFVEGTRFTEDKKIKAHSFAKERNLPVLENVLLPRTKGFVATVSGLESNAAAIYDVTIGHKSRALSLWEIVTSRNNVFHLHVKRYSIEELPKEEKKLTEWLITRFCEKDIRLQEFKIRGGF